MKRPVDRHLANEIAVKPSHKRKTATDDQIEVKMRILANYVIDRLLEMQEETVKKGLNTKQKKDMLIMEHSLNKT